MLLKFNKFLILLMWRCRKPSNDVKPNNILFDGEYNHLTK